ncbi:unnamed protein product [Pleuronectes platessa]|uniref:Uncharacterized protein n=1 Tax=Pleuronectes platessa TaxID=8262 RepID=A0A9N7U298_PLEPL|nr:unnamed protein product [Pleuronectes platessa]
MRTARPESPSWPGDRVLLAWRGGAVTLSLQSSAGLFHSAQGYPRYSSSIAIRPDRCAAAASSPPTVQFDGKVEGDT